MTGGGLRSGAIYAELDGATGWDISDKALWFHNDGHTGDVTFDELQIDGFRGELIYQGGHTHGSIKGRRLILSNTDADGFNPTPFFNGDGGGGVCNIEHLTIRNCWQALEGGTGTGQSRIGLLEVEDCHIGGTLNGGAYRTRPDMVVPHPSLHIDRIRASRSGSIGFTYNTSVADVTVVDMAVHLGHDQGNLSFSRVGKITLVTDRRGAAIVIRAWPVNSDAYQFAPAQDNHVGEIVHVRTDHARNNEISAGSALSWHPDSRIGPNFRIGKVSGEYKFGPSAFNAKSGPAGFYPCLEEIGDDVRPGPAAHDVGAMPAIPFLSALVQKLVVTDDDAGDAPFTLPSPDGKWTPGSRIRLLNASRRTMILGIAHMRGMERPMPLLPGRAYEFETDGSHWTRR